MSPKLPEISQWPDLTRGKQPVIDWAKERGLNLYDATQPLDPNRKPNFRNQTPYPTIGQTSLPPIPGQTQGAATVVPEVGVELDKYWKSGGNYQSQDPRFSIGEFGTINWNQGQGPGSDAPEDMAIPNLGQINLPPIPQASSMASGVGAETIPGLNETAVQTGNPLEDMFPQGMGLGANYADLFGG